MRRYQACRGLARSLRSRKAASITGARAQRGVSLIEVMVSLFIVSLGILALAGLLSIAARAGKASELRASATLLANDLADRIRANPGATMGVSSRYQWLPDAYPTRPTPPVPPPKSVCSASAPCSPHEIAELDLFEWRRRLYYALPGGYGSIAFTAADAGKHGAQIDVWVAWTERVTSRDEGAATGGGLECPRALRHGAVRCLHLRVAL